MGRLSLTPTAIHRAVETFAVSAPAAAARATAALDTLLEGIHRSPWQDVSWNFSRLTGDGFPVEFTVSSSDDAIRYTTEVAGPEVRNEERLAYADKLLQHLGTAGLSNSIAVQLHAIQQSGPLLYGAWIGGRHSANGDRYKIYAEVPRQHSEASDRFVSSLLGETSLLPSRPVSLRMIGHELGSSRIELYFRVEALESWEARTILRWAGLASRHADLLSFIEQVSGRPVEPVLPGSKLGFSFSISQTGEPTVVTLFCFARSLFGGDDRTRQRLLSAADRWGWNFDSYARLSEPFANRSGCKTRHGMVSFVLPPVGSPALAIGLRPEE